jgi:hypothetical protein
MNTEPIDDPADAAVGRHNPRLDVNKGLRWLLEFRRTLNLRTRRSR